MRLPTLQRFARRVCVGGWSGQPDFFFGGILLKTSFFFGSGRGEVRMVRLPVFRWNFYNEIKRNWRNLVCFVLTCQVTVGCDVKSFAFGTWPWETTLTLGASGFPPISLSLRFWRCCVCVWVGCGGSGTLQFVTPNETKQKKGENNTELVLVQCVLGRRKNLSSVQKLWADFVGVIHCTENECDGIAQYFYHFCGCILFWKSVVEVCCVARASLVLTRCDRTCVENKLCAHQTVEIINGNTRSADVLFSFSYTMG